LRFEGRRVLGPCSKGKRKSDTGKRRTRGGGVGPSPERLGTSQCLNLGKKGTGKLGKNTHCQERVWVSGGKERKKEHRSKGGLTLA